MSALNISCNICKKNFKKSDQILTSSCGHLFHNNCGYNWRNCLKSCCTDILATHPVFLNICDTQDHTLALRNDLKEANDEIEVLKIKLNQKQSDIQKICEEPEQEKRKFQNEINKLTEENEKLKNLLSVNKDIEALEQRISKLTKENAELKETIHENESSKVVLNYKIEILEKRLKHLTLELKKQIEENISKSIGNLDQPQNENESELDEIHYLAHTEGTSEDLNNSTENLKNSTENLKNSTDNLNNSIKNLTRKIHGNKFILLHPNDSRISITNLSRNELVHPLAYTILNLAAKMSISLTIDEILQVKMKDSVVFPDKVGLLVEFKTVNTKVNFLQQKHRLRSHPSTKYVQIKEFINDSIFPLYMYAKDRLRLKGYGYIYCKDNRVYGKKSANDVEEIFIKDKNQVDSIVAGTNISKK